MCHNGRPEVGISGLILASGASRRFRSGNKLLAPVEGVAVVRRVARAFLDAGLDHVSVVVGYEAEAVRAALTGLSLSYIENPEYEQGQSRALVRGVAGLQEATQAAVIGVGDQPFLTSEIIRRIIEAYRSRRRPIVVPWYGDTPGNPVLYNRSTFPELLTVTGDRGGRVVRDRDPERVLQLDLRDMPRAGLDLDTREEWERLTM